MQEHASSEHFSQEGAAFGCSLCPLVCPSQLQLQGHFLSCHIGALQDGEEEASTSQTVKLLKFFLSHVLQPIFETV